MLPPTFVGYLGLAAVGLATPRRRWIMLSLVPLRGGARAGISLDGSSTLLA